jgi:hypothetical protein
MARPWWQRLLKPKRQNPDPTSHPNGRVWDRGFEVSDFVAGGWWLRAESKPVRVGLVAAAKAVPALLTAWTFHTPPLPEPPMPRGAERLALLCEWGVDFAL